MSRVNLGIQIGKEIKSKNKKLVGKVFTGRVEVGKILR